MLTIICGEDTVASRDYFNKLKADFQNNGYQTSYILPHDLRQISMAQIHTPTLFNQKTAYFSENLLAKFKEKNLPEATIIDWEEKSLYELKIPKGAVVKEFKPPNSLFKLLDACYPGNSKTFLTILHQLPDKIEDGFIFFMLAKQIRNLLLIKMDQKITNLPSWQLTKLKFQARRWSTEKLLAFSEGLYRIDVSTKTSTNPFDIRKSLDILACYFL
ncbi:MAG: hypothetical protein ACK4FL_03215 [Microgenomates group bacterium]